MRIGYFPGCSLHATAREYDESLKAVAAALDLELDEIKDWACCGATSAHATNRTLAIALAARTLMLAEKQDLDSILAPCAACYNRLATARRALIHDSRMAERIRSVLGYEFSHVVEVVNIAAFLNRSAAEIGRKVKKPLAGLKIACYYGCLLVRPPEVCRFDDCEAPQSMENIVSTLGGAPVRWNMALECCGGGFSLARTGSVVRLGRLILQDALAAGAEALLVACPMCHSNLDFRQQAMLKHGGLGKAIPVIFVTELVGLSLGLDPDKLGLGRHFVSVQPLVERFGATRAG